MTTTTLPGQGALHTFPAWQVTIVSPSSLLYFQDYKTLVQWGVMEWRRGNIDTARRLFDRCTAMVPRYTHVVYLHCTMLWQEGLIDEARQLFQRTSDAFGRCAAGKGTWIAWLPCTLLCRIISVP